MLEGIFIENKLKALYFSNFFTKCLKNLKSLHKWFPHLSQQISANSFLLAKIAHSNISEMVDVSVDSVIFMKFDIQICPLKTHYHKIITFHSVTFLFAFKWTVKEYLEHDLGALLPKFSNLNLEISKFHYGIFNLSFGISNLNHRLFILGVKCSDW